MKTRNGFKKLLLNVKMNGVSQDEDGEWTLIASSTNKKRMEKNKEGSWWGSCQNSKTWVPSKVMITEQDLRSIWIAQKGRCYWFDIPLDLNLLFSDSIEYIPKHPLAPSVDKILEKGDYTVDNIVICCRLANFGRNVCPHDTFKDIVEIVTKKKEVSSLDIFFNTIEENNLNS